jgi:predicted ATPase
MNTQEELLRIDSGAHDFGSAGPALEKKGVVRLDWMLALGRSSLDRGDLRTALKYFNMVLGLDSENPVAQQYLNMTLELMEKRKERATCP